MNIPSSYDPLQPCLEATANPEELMALAAERPHASRVFANELLHGAPVVLDLLRTDLRQQVLDKAAVIDGWIAAGRMAPVDSVHLFFTIWAATQTYADFDVQIHAVLGTEPNPATDTPRATSSRQMRGQP